MKTGDYFKAAEESIDDDRMLNAEKYMKYGPRGFYRNKHLMLPHGIGVVIGFAVARLFSLGFAFYLILGVVFAFLFGTYKSHAFDGISWKYALAKNALLTLPILLLFLIILISFLTGV